LHGHRNLLLSYEESAQTILVVHILGEEQTCECAFRGSLPALIKYKECTEKRVELSTTQKKRK
jgi:hypothetical protein